MPKLIVDPHLDAPDAFYEALVELHRDRTEAESARLNARLILILANHIGDGDVLDEALRLAAGERSTQRG